MFLFVYNVAMYYIPYSFLPPIAAVITLEGLARVAVRHAEAAEHGDHADAAQAGEVRAAAGGAFRKVVERIQAGPILSSDLLLFLLPQFTFFLIEKRIIVKNLFTNHFIGIMSKIFASKFISAKSFFSIVLAIFPSPLQGRATIQTLFFHMHK